MLSKVTPIVVVALLCVALVTEASVGLKGKKKFPVRPGGWKKVDVTSPEVQAAATKAAMHLEGARNSAMAYRLQEVTSAKVQIVRGKNYQLVLKIGQTGCFRREGVNVQNCSVVKVERCAVTVHVWQNTTQVTNFTCGKEKASGGGGGRKSTRMPMLGGETDIDVSRDDVIQAATFATAELTSRSNERYRVQQQRIVKATSQVVAGAMYRLILEVGVTSSGSNKAKTARCTVKVWDQAWRTPRYTLEEYKCNRLIS